MHKISDFFRIFRKKSLGYQFFSYLHRFFCLVESIEIGSDFVQSLLLVYYFLGILASHLLLSFLQIFQNHQTRLKGLFLSISVFRWRQTDSLRQWHSNIDLSHGRNNFLNCIIPLFPAIEYHSSIEDESIVNHFLNKLQYLISNEWCSHKIGEFPGKELQQNLGLIHKDSEVDKFFESSHARHKCIGL